MGQLVGMVKLAERHTSLEKDTQKNVLRHPSADFQLTAEYALRAAIDSQIFSTLRELEALDGGRAVQSVYVALLRRLPNVTPDRRRIGIDCGFSESSVKRAIGLLELCGLVEVKRSKGQSSVYHLADIRRGDIGTECLSRIRKLSRRPKRGTVIGPATCRPTEMNSRVTSEPTRIESRVTSEPGSRVTSEPGVGSLLTHKETKKKQYKQQGVVDEGKELRQIFEKWGLTSAAYLSDPKHEKSLAVLCETPTFAAAVIERVMRKCSWSKDSGVGLKVQVLRANAGIAASQIRAEANLAKARPGRARKRASEISSTLEARAFEQGEIDELLFNDLLECGLRRLNESKEVISSLRSDEVACTKIVGDEIGRNRCEELVQKMSDESFATTCDELFSRRPGLRSLYPQPEKSCNGLRLVLMDAILNGEVGDGLLKSQEVSLVPREQPLETPG